MHSATFTLTVTTDCLDSRGRRETSFDSEAKPTTSGPPRTESGARYQVPLYIIESAASLEFIRHRVHTLVDDVFDHAGLGLARPSLDEARTLVQAVGMACDRFIDDPKEREMWRSRLLQVMRNPEYKGVQPPQPWPVPGLEDLDPEDGGS